MSSGQPSLGPRMMRRLNTDAVLDALYSRRCCTLAELSTATGLSRRTVELILADLEAEGWVRTIAADPTTGALGRPARRFAFRPRAGAVMAISIAHETSTVAIADLYGDIRSQVTVEIDGDPGPRTRLAVTRDGIRAALDEVGLTARQIGNVTIATPGNVNDQGAVDVELSMSGWRGIKLGEEFATDFACPIHVENDAKLAVLAEMWRGATPGADHLLWLLLEGPFLGLSLVVDGTPLRGVDGAAGEITWAHTLGLRELSASPLLSRDQPSTSARREAVRDTIVRARAGDAGAVEDVRQFAITLARGLSTVSWVIAPRYVVLGGSVSKTLGDLLLEPVRKTFADLGPEFVEVKLTEVDGAVILGAVRDALDRIDWRTFRRAEPIS